MDTRLKQLTSLTDPITNSILAERVRLLDDRIYIDCPYPVHPSLGNHYLLLKEMIHQSGLAMDDITFQLKAPQPPVKDDKPTPLLGNIIAVGSGKGGVGKSTVSSGIAKALHALGARVGLLDGDIYGANQDILMGLVHDTRTRINAKKEFIPFDVDGLSLMTFAGVTGSDIPVVWRGPMISNAFQQMMTNTEWPQLDYLIVDMPPGTGDIQLTLFQQFAVTGALLVTTPQRMAVEEVKKTLSMTEKLGIHCLGIVENMNSFLCNNCNTKHAIFGDRTQALIESKGLNQLGSLPIDIDLHGDAGELLFDLATAHSQECVSIAERMTASLARHQVSQRGSVIATG